MCKAQVAVGVEQVDQIGDLLERLPAHFTEDPAGHEGAESGAGRSGWPALGSASNGQRAGDSLSASLLEMNTNCP